MHSSIVFLMHLAIPIGFHFGRARVISHALIILHP